MAKGKNEKRAAEIAAQFKVNEVFENSKGEFFTRKDLALLSEGGKTDNVYTYTVNGNPAASGDKEGDEEKLIERIGKAKTPEAVAKLVEGATSAAVIKAGEDRNSELAKPKE